MGRRGVVLGTAGHVDHGKTALVAALTGKSTDRLPEEQRRGLSIELGFAELELPDGSAISVVDVPGHEDLVRTMVAGASGIDLFLMVIAANDGVMPQTVEHWTVLKTLGVVRGVIALTKIDVADAAQAERARSEAAALLPGQPIVEVNPRRGIGVATLNAAISQLAATVADETEARDSAMWPEPAVLHVDRVFSLTGIGTVATGTLWSGEICQGDRVEILPRGLLTHVRSIQSHNRKVSRALPGLRTALNLGVRRSELRRGDVIASSGAGLVPTYRLDCRLRLASHEAVGSRVKVHHGTRAVSARLVGLQPQDLWQVRLDDPLVARPGDRLVVRGIAPPGTLGGGEVIEAHPRRHAGDVGSDLCEIIENGSPEAVLETAVNENPKGISVDRGEWARLTVIGGAHGRFSPDRWEETVARMLDTGSLRISGRSLFPGAPSPHARGVGAAPSNPKGSVTADAVLSILISDGRSPRAPGDIAEALSISREDVLRSLNGLVAAGSLTRVTPSIFYPPAVVARLCEHVLRLAVERGSVSLPEARDELGISRKHAQALLERLNRERQLVRRGEDHFLQSRCSHGCP